MIAYLIAYIVKRVHIIIFIVIVHAVSYNKL